MRLTLRQNLSYNIMAGGKKEKTFFAPSLPNRNSASLTEIQLSGPYNLYSNVSAGPYKKDDK